MVSVTPALPELISLAGFEGDYVTLGTIKAGLLYLNTGEMVPNKAI